MKVNVSFDRFIANDLLDAASFEPFAERESLVTVTNIKTNLDLGLDADGQALRPYSPGYARMLEAEGESTTVDLLRSGDLRRAMQVRRTPGGAEVYFLGQHRRSGMSAATLAQSLEDRGFVHWFGMGMRDTDRIERAAGEWLDEQLKKIETEKGRP